MKAKIHLLFWSGYFLYVYITDAMIDESAQLPIEILFFLSHNILLFYSFSAVLNYYQRTKSKGRALAFGALCTGLFWLVRYTLRYKIIAPYFDPVYAELPVDECAVGAILWVSNYFIFASAYFYFNTSLREQRLLAELSLQHQAIIKENHAKDRHRLELENMVLKTQINPHFLYNTLNLLYSKSLPLSDELAQGILKLSEMMRYSLEAQADDGTVLLEQELIHLRNITELARLRFTQGLYLDMDVPEEIGDIRIIPFALITIVENIFKHGVLSDPEHPARIQLAISEDCITFSTWNKKRVGPKERSTSIGLKNTVERLRNAYGDQVAFTTSDTGDTFETSLILSILQRTTPAAANAFTYDIALRGDLSNTAPDPTSIRPAIA